MKKIKSGKGIIALLTALLLALVLWAGFSPPASVSEAKSSSETVAAPLAYGGSYYFSEYNVDIEVFNDRTAKVVERMTVQLSRLHGIIRDFPVGDGVTYSNITSKCSSTDYAPYLEKSGSSFLSYYMGGESYVTGERIYTLEYEMQFKKLANGYLPLNVIGFGNGGEINNVTAHITVPDGLKQHRVYSGGYGTGENRYAAYTLSENVFTITAEKLPMKYFDDAGNLVAAGITLDMEFSPDAFVHRFDFSILYAFLLGGALLLVAVLVKLFVCKQPLMTVSVNLEAPDEMDPMMMGLLIDGTVDSEDMGALVFWLASEGYLSIDMQEDKDDPLLIKTDKRMYDDVPAHCRIIYEGLFDMREKVRVSELGNSFYSVSESAKASVVANKGKTHGKKGPAFAVLFGILSVLLLGGFAWLFSLGKITGYHYLAVFFSSLIAFCAATACSWFASRKFYKRKKSTSVATVCGGVLLGAVVGLFAMLLFPGAAMGMWSVFVLTLFASLTGAVCGFFFCRTKEFTQKLGHILGFKQFITVTEKDRIKVMLEEEPELYYRVLPYAQVLGVTDVWSDKFEGLDMKQPTYMNYSGVDFIFDYLIWRMFFRTMSGSLVRNMVSRPSSSGRSGRFGGFRGGGGFGGGFGGGGFGGGGSRGF